LKQVGVSFVERKKKILSRVFVRKMKNKNAEVNKKFMNEDDDLEMLLGELFFSC